VATFYTISDRRFFIGTAALLNSLALAGHTDDTVVLDCGLTDDQRRRLGESSRVVPAPREHGTGGAPLKPVAVPDTAGGVVVLIDSDMLVTGSLEPLLAAAEEGRVAAFADLTPERRFESWQAALGLPAPPREQPYVNAGLIAFSTVHQPALLRRWRELCRVAIDAGGPSPEPAGPFWKLEQDVLNALLMTEVEAGALAVFDHRRAPMPWNGADVRVEDVRLLRCRGRGGDVLVLHHAGPGKPWDGDAWRAYLFDPFVSLLPRVLFGPDVRLRLRRRDVPPGLWPGRAGAVVRFSGRVVRALRRRLPPRRRG